MLCCLFPGKYVVTAKNDSGTDTVEIEVSVVSKPAKPKGPLKVSLELTISLSEEFPIKLCRWSYYIYF